MARGVRSASTRHRHHALNGPAVNNGLERTITSKQAETGLIEILRTGVGGAEVSVPMPPGAALALNKALDAKPTPLSRIAPYRPTPARSLRRSSPTTSAFSARSSVDPGAVLLPARCRRRTAGRAGRKHEHDAHAHCVCRRSRLPDRGDTIARVRTSEGGRYGRQTVLHVRARRSEAPSTSASLARRASHVGRGQCERRRPGHGRAR